MHRPHWIVGGVIYQRTRRSLKEEGGPLRFTLLAMLAKEVLCWSGGGLHDTVKYFREVHIAQLDVAETY